jgi:hypothetical protein
MPDETHDPDVSDDWIVDHGLERRALAQELIREVEPLFRQGLETKAESVARRSLGLFASSLNWLEDTVLFDEAHELMDLAGRYVRVTFGCELRWDGRYYEQSCPVWFAHTRIGFSPELLIKKRECSICGESPDSCSHITGRSYDGEFCVYQPTSFEPIGAVAMVSRPAQPDARIQTQRLTIAELRPSLSEDWRPGMSVPCSRCLDRCSGVREVDFDNITPDEFSADAGDDSPPMTIVIMIADTPMKA